MFEKMKEKYPQDIQLLEKFQGVCSGDVPFVYADGIGDEKAQDYKGLFKACCGEDAIVIDVETLLNELVDFIIFKKNPDEFYGKYQKCRALVLSGFETCLGKSATQEELYQLLKYRVDNKLTTVVLSSFVHCKKDGLLSDCLFDLLNQYGA